MEQRVFVKRKPIKCPKCGFKPISKVVYGYPSHDYNMQNELKNKKIVLGGCCICKDNPLWHCTNCNTDFYLKVESLEELLIKQK